MAVQNTQFPERDRDVVTYAQFSGLRNDVDPERFELGDLAVADNLNIDKTGQMSRRGGFTQRVAGSTHSIWADETETICMYVEGGTLKHMQPNLTGVAVTALQDAVSPMAYMRVSDRVYFANGQDKGVFENSAVRTWGLPVAPLPGATTAFGQLPAGTYQFAMTWLRSDGQESGCGLAGVIELDAGGGIRFVVPPAPQADIVAAVLYVSPANSDKLLEAVTVEPGTTTTWQTDPASLSRPLDTQFYGPPPAGHLVAHYRGHTFVAVGDTIFISKQYGYELFNLRRYLQLDGRITLLAPHTDKETSDVGRGSGFFVGTDRSMGVMAGSDPDSFQYTPKLDYGAVPGALRYVDASIVRDGGGGGRKLPMWLSAKGVCLGLPDMLINNLTRARFEFAAGGRGAAVLLPNPNRFIATSNL